MTSISQAIKQRRTSLGLSLSQLARRVNTSAATLSRYESGWDRFEVRTLRKLAAALSCELCIAFEPYESPQRKIEPAEVVNQLKRLFWDRPLDQPALGKFPVWVLQRVLEMGALEDVHTLLAFFGRDRFLALAADVRFSSPKTANFWREIFLREGISCMKKFSREGAENSWIH